MIKKEGFIDTEIHEKLDEITEMLKNILKLVLQPRKTKCDNCGKYIDDTYVLREKLLCFVCYHWRK